MAVETGQQPVLPGLKAELIGRLDHAYCKLLNQQWYATSDPPLASGDCTWTLQQNQSVITALKRENKDLKAALAALSPASSSRQVSVQQR